MIEPRKDCCDETASVVCGDCPRKVDPWAQLIKIAREIQPDLPVDIHNYEVRITLNRDFQAVECMLLSAVKGAALK